MSCILACVFDLGGVVLGSPLEGIREYEIANGIPEGFVNVAIVSHGKQGAFQKLERGELPVDVFIQQFRKELADPIQVTRFRQYLKKKNRLIPSNLPESFDIDTADLYARMMSKARTINTDMCHVLFCLRGMGIKVFALTNNWKESGNSDSSSTRFLTPYFDEIIESAVIGIRKPSRDIYAYTTTRLGVEPDQVLFLDDIGINLKAAGEFGWHTIRVEIGQVALAIETLAVRLGRDRYFFNSTVVAKYPVGHAGGELVCDVFGRACNPIVLFLHGGGQTRHTWENTAKDFVARGYCAVTVDMKGHGESYWDDHPVSEFRRYSTDAYSKDLDSIVKRMRLHLRPFALVGASLGGLAILNSSLAKDAAAAIVLVDITPRMNREGVIRITSWMKHTSNSGFASLEDAAAAIQLYKPSSKARDVAYLAGLRKNLRQNKDGRFVWHWDPRFLDNSLDPSEDDLDAVEERLFAHASTTTTPCLLVRGKLTDLVSEEAAKRFVHVMPNAKYVDVEQASHMVVGDKNDIFSDQTLQFLSQHLPSDLNSKL